MSAEKFDHAALIAEARNETACICPDLLDGPARSCGEHGDEHSRLFARVIDALEAVQQTPAVDTGKAAKAIWEVLWPGTSDVMDDAELGQERAQVARVLFSLTGSGILLDAAEVEARGLEKVADALIADEYDPDDQVWEPVSGTYMHPSGWLRARAQQVREGNA